VQAIRITHANERERFEASKGETGHFNNGVAGSEYREG
jgi:hypothetical protein